jgi:hypothetical protein
MDLMLNPGHPTWAAIAEHAGRQAKENGEGREVPKPWAPYASQWLTGYDA